MNSNPEILSATQVRQSLSRVAVWVEANDYKGYEPFDGLSSWARPLTFGNLFAERLLQQLVRQSPINIRPLLGVTKKDSTKGQGYMAWGYLVLYRTTGEPELLDKATHCLEWLDRNKVARFKYHSWANHFTFSSRGGRYGSEDPIIVWTSLIAHAYCEAYELTRQERFLRIAESACRWIMGLPRERTSSGNCLSYMAHLQESIHNSSMLGAGILARVGRHLGNEEFVEVARSAMEYSCSRQLPDGSWWYGEEPRYHWIDNFHTGYNLESLKHYTDATGDETFRSNLKRGLEFFKGYFFEESGRPKYYHNRTYPVDIQCASQSIDTLAVLADEDPASLALACKVARWTIENMQDRRGYFYYRQYPLLTARTPMLHWGQATMYKALTVLHQKLTAKPAFAEVAQQPQLATV